VTARGGELDHVGIAANSLEDLAAMYRRLGFTLAPYSRHTGPAADGTRKPIGTANHCIMLRDGYLELIAIVEPGLFAFHLEEDLQRYEGIHIIAFGTSDPEGTAARLRREGFPAETYALSRMVETSNGPQEARFTNLPLPRGTFREANVFYLRHETRETLWEPHLVRHENQAVSLNEVVIAVADLSDAGARFERFLGVEPSSQGPALIFRLSRGRVVLVLAEQLGDVLPGVTATTTPFVASITLGSADISATRTLLAERRIATREGQGRLMVDRLATGGVTLCFEAAS
jgi:Glyoxalase-like domain